MDQRLQFILDQNRPIQDRVQLLDELTLSIMNNRPDSKQAHEIWNTLKEDHYFWYNSDQVLRLSKIDQTKVFTLVILENAIKQKWGALPHDQRENIKSYIVNVVLEYGAIQNLPKSMHNILSKANAILVQIVKYEWNTTWTSFINDICNASTKDMNICQNNFFILKMLSEQIFDYSKNQLTQKQIAQLKSQMTKDFTTIYQLCSIVLKNVNQAKQSLVKACLETLNAFLSWIPLHYIIYTQLINQLITILNSDSLRNYSLQCLVQIASLPTQGNKDFQLKQQMMLTMTTIQLNKIIPLTSKSQTPKLIASVRRNARHVFEILARQIILFYSQFFKNQIQWLQIVVVGQQQIINVCRMGLQYIVMLMLIQQEQVFKISIEFFHFLIGRHLQKIKNQTIENKFLQNGLTLDKIYPPIFHQVMQIAALRMAKPQQVLIVIDQAGFPVRQQLQNTQNASLYQIMRQLASYLANYDWPDMKKFIITQIQKQQNQGLFSFDTLNSLSWITGSLCGSILQKQEKSFFISTLRTLLHLCEMKKGKDNKAVIASCIMYVVGQYPTFLRNNWTFLQTVVKKLFEFMKEQFPGIMEMACNAFLKIVKSTADQFVIIQANNSQPYINEIIQRIPQQTKKLNSDALKLIFYQSVGYLINAEQNSQLQLQMMKQTIGSHFFQFQNIMNMAKQNPNILKQQQIQHKILYFLKINQNLAVGVGQQYLMLLQIISQVINKLYLYYSGQVNQVVTNNGKHMLNFLTIKMMRAIKKQVIKIYSSYLQKCNHLNLDQANYILNRFIFPLGTLLKDFQDCLPETKQQQFVSLFTLVLQKLNGVINSDFLSKLVQMIFASSLPLITTDFNSFPQIRSSFFAFLKALIKYNFGLLYSLDQNHFSTILDCVIWSFRHQLSNYSDLGLQLIQDILNNVSNIPQIANAFYPKYHLRLMTDILDVMTDGFHKSGLQSQSKVFYILIDVVAKKKVVVPIGNDQSPNQSNIQYLFKFLVSRLSSVFKNISQQVTVEKVNNWFCSDQKTFKLQVADYLVLINRYTAQQVKENVKTGP